MVADPGHREIGDRLLVLAEAIEGVAVLRRDDQVLEGEHDALRPTGRAGCVEQDGKIAPRRLRDRGEPARFRFGALRETLPSRRLHRVEGVEMRRIVAPQAPLLVVDDGLQARQPRGDRKDLVDLLLVLHHRRDDLGVLEHIGHLVGDGIGIERHGHCAERLSRADRPIEPRAVLPDDGDLVAAGNPERGEAQGEGAHLVEHVRPGPRLPYAEVLLAHGRPSPANFGIAEEQLRERVVAGSRNGVHDVSYPRWRLSGRSCRPECTVRGAEDKRCRGRRGGRRCRITAGGGIGPHFLSLPRW